MCLTGPPMVVCFHPNIHISIFRGVSFLLHTLISVLLQHLLQLSHLHLTLTFTLSLYPNPVPLNVSSIFCHSNSRPRNNEYCLCSLSPGGGGCRPTLFFSFLLTLQPYPTAIHYWDVLMFVSCLVLWRVPSRELVLDYNSKNEYAIDYQSELQWVLLPPPSFPLSPRAKVCAIVP